nr:hypothetical protein [Tanacetum cinerariifolium]
MQGASFTQGIVSSISIGGSISPEGFLLPILLLVVIIVTVVIVAVILIVIVVAIVEGFIVVAIIREVVVIDGVSSILKLSFGIIGFLCRIVFYYLIHQPLGYVDSFLESLWFRSSNVSFNSPMKRIRLKRDKSEQKRTKSDKNGKRVEAEKSLKQLH